MTVTNDWMFDYTGTTSLDNIPTFQHVDGVLLFDGRTAGNSPALGDYIMGLTSGAVAKVIGGDVGVADAAGSLELTNVRGLLEDGEQLQILATVPFDTVTNGGFKIGDILDDGAAASITVEAIEYNIGTIDGAGIIYGSTYTSGFADEDPIELSGTQVASVEGVEAAAGTWDADCDGQLAPPGTANTNNAIIINYDTGTIDFPHEARISTNTTYASGAYGKVQKLWGATLTGSLFLINSNHGATDFADNDSLYIHDVIPYDALISGKVFQVGDVVRDKNTPASIARVIAVIEDTGVAGKIITAGKTGTFGDGQIIERLLADDSYEDVADVNGTTSYLDAADVNNPAASPVITTQRASEGGIYGAGSLNILRDVVEVYGLVKGTMDDLLQLDDKSIIDGQVKDQLYIIKDDWRVPDLSWRFCENGGVQDEAGNNVFTNEQSSGALYAVGNHGFFYDATNPSPMPDLYIEQNDALLDQFWLKGHINVLIKKKTKTHPQYIDPNVEGLGQLIDGGTIGVHCREYLRTYASAYDSKVGGVSPIFLQTRDDANNTTGGYQFAYNTGGQLTVGEEITTGTGNALKVGIVTAGDSGATGNIEYVHKSGAAFVATDVVTGGVSGQACTLTSTIVNLVAGYGAGASPVIRTMVVTDQVSGGSTTVDVFVLGELVTQDVTGATGYFMEDDGTIYLEKLNATAFSGASNDLVGQTSGATYTGTLTFDTAQTTVPKDAGDGSDNDYTACSSGKATDGTAQNIINIYEWNKFITSKEATYTFPTAGDSSTTTVGNIYRRLAVTFFDSADAPLGYFAGGKYFTAQGHFIDYNSLHANDLQNIETRDNANVAENPPNIQSIGVTGLTIGYSVGLYRSTGSGSEDIQTTEYQVGAGNAAVNTVIVIQSGDKTATRNDVPDSGVLRVEDPNNAGIFLRFPYSSVNRATHTFTLTSGTIGDVTGATALTQTDGVFIPFVEKTAAAVAETNNIEYVENFYIVAVARSKGKKPFTGSGEFTGAGGSIGAVFNTDPSVNLP